MLVVGIDEVGRGCWAGPLVAGAVLLERPIAGLKDSKLLSKKRRESLVLDIELEATAYGLGWVTPEEVDTLGITTAVKRAMERAFAAVCEQVATFDEVIIDGNINYLPNEPKAHELIKADMTIPAVSAASILAKVARDRYMEQMALEYPQYGFDKHVGYGTAAHIAALKSHGICILHRKSYKPIRQLIGATA
jgi:ribonuclease HII